MSTAYEIRTKLFQNHTTEMRKQFLDENKFITRVKCSPLNLAILRKLYESMFHICGVFGGQYVKKEESADFRSLAHLDHDEGKNILDSREECEKYIFPLLCCRRFRLFYSGIKFIFSSDVLEMFRQLILH